MSNIVSSLPAITGLQTRPDSSQSLRELWEMATSGKPLDASHRQLREKMSLKMYSMVLKRHSKLV